MDLKISVKNITKKFGNFVALSHINIEFTDGEFTTLLGPSGCGKTTLLRIIAGLETADEGDIYFDETCVYSNSKRIHVPPEKRELAFVFQDFALWPHMTVFENVAFGLRARRQTGKLNEKVNEALSAVQLSDFANQFPHRLSGGQQQRVAFARAIAVSPKFILFDEPLSALDAILRDEMRIELKRLVKEREITSIFVTHDQLEAMSMSDKIAVFDQGKIAQIGKPEEIYYKPNSISVAKFVGRSNWLASNQMIRPENTWINQPPKKHHPYKQLTMKVKDVQFMGNYYEVLVGDEKNRWFIPTSNRYLPNEDVTVYIDETELINF